MADQELLSRVSELRERGYTPKEIAHVLGVRPSAVAPLVRQVAEARQREFGPADRALEGCWISPGWSVGLGVDVPEWAALDPDADADTEPGSSGLALVMIARRERASRVTVCGFLLDVYCLGVKNTVGPETMGAGKVYSFSRRFFSSFEGLPISIPVELAQHLVHGSVAYARSLGFEPQAEFQECAPHLGTPPGQPPIRFGRDGKPFYVSGPHDNAGDVMNTLQTKVGAGNFEYLVSML